jgi:hypothetical protein
LGGLSLYLVVWHLSYGPFCAKKRRMALRNGLRGWFLSYLLPILGVFLSDFSWLEVIFLPFLISEQRNRNEND